MLQHNDKQASSNKKDTTLQSVKDTKQSVIASIVTSERSKKKTEPAEGDRNSAITIDNEEKYRAQEAIDHRSREVIVATRNYEASGTGSDKDQPTREDKRWSNRQEQSLKTDPTTQCRRPSRNEGGNHAAALNER
jgi:hypothetical protein